MLVFPPNIQKTTARVFFPWISCIEIVRIGKHDFCTIASCWPLYPLIYGTLPFSYIFQTLRSSPIPSQSQLWLIFYSHTQNIKISYLLLSWAHDLHMQYRIWIQGFDIFVGSGWKRWTEELHDQLPLCHLRVEIFSLWCVWMGWSWPIIIAILYRWETNLLGW